MTSKQQIREQARRARQSFVQGLSAGDRARCFAVPPSPLTRLLGAGRTLAGYWPIGDEADPLRLMACARAAGCAIALPRVTGRVTPMSFHLWEEDDPLEAGPFSLRQPPATAPVARPDIVLVPLVAFDRAGTRLGQGAGHYDRALCLLDPVVAVGVGWSAQEFDALSADPWDQPLDAILTEREWIVP